MLCKYTHILDLKTMELDLGFDWMKTIYLYCLYYDSLIKLGLVFRKTLGAYSYENHLSLTKDTSLFTNTVSEIRIKGNLDDPEAAFDGLMQVMVCKNEIGWRNESKKIIIVCTDAPYHSAGDGKFVGAFKPNDMKCHLKNEKYEDSLKYDYPSVSQINRITLEKGFNIIFAGTRNRKQIYENLIRSVKRSTYAELKEESDITEIIKEEYMVGDINIKFIETFPFNNILYLFFRKFHKLCTLIQILQIILIYN